MERVRKAVVPAAGLGTRFLPVTKTVPKELLPLISKPTLHYIVEELSSSGVEEVILVLSSIKMLVKNYFDVGGDYERELRKKRKEQMLDGLKQLVQSVELKVVFQEEAKGLGHATLCAKEEVGDEFFLLVLPDVIVDSHVPCARQLMNAFDKVGKGIITTQRKPRSELSKYGVLEIESSEGRVHKLSGLIEKPAPDEAPSNYVVSGQYLLPPSVFELIEATEPGALGEIQITDALDKLAKIEGLYAYEFEGELFDTGDKAGFLMANLHFGLKDEGIRDQLVGFLRRVVFDNEE